MRWFETARMRSLREQCEQDEAREWLKAFWADQLPIEIRVVQHGDQIIYEAWLGDVQR